MKDILPYLKPYRRRIALAMLLVAAATVCDLLLPTIMNDILNNGVRQSDFAYIVRCCAWMLAVAAAGLAALLAGRKISCDVVAGFNADLRTDVFSLVNNMTFEEFNAIGAAALLSRSTYDIGTVSWVASMISGSLITIPVLFFGGVILALRKDVMMSLILLLFVPAIFLIVRPISKRIGPLHETSDKYIDIQNDVMRERLHGIRVIRAFNKEASLQQKIADATHVMAENIINANVQMGLLSPAAVLLVNLAGVAIIWIGGWRMETGSHAISGGDIFAIIQYLALVANGVLMGGFAMVMLPHAKVAADRIGEIFHATGMQETAKGAEHTFRGEIALDHVPFRYEGRDYTVTVRDVKLFPQGYAAVLTQTELLDEPSVIVADIGGWTVDLMRLDNRLPNAATCRSLEWGMIRCIDEISEQVRRVLGLSLTTAQIECVLRGDASSLPDEAKGIIHAQADLYVQNLLSTITECGLDTRAMPTIFIGGGAALMKRRVSATNGLCRPVILDDVSLNAKGYERLVRQMSGSGAHA